MGSKRQVVRRADLPVPVTGGASSPFASVPATPEQARPIAPAPTGLFVIASGYERSGPSPSAYAQVGWFPGTGTPASATWELEWSRASDFSQTPIKKASTNPGEVRGLIPGTTYIRVRAVVAGMPGRWSAALAVTISPLSDAPPPPPTGLTVAWSPTSGDVTIRATRPAGEQIQGVRVRIYTASGGTLLRTVDTTDGLFVWTLDMQRQDRGGSLPLPAAATCFVLVNTVSWAGNLSSDVSATATLPAPAVPTGLANTWAGDSGLASATCRVSWTGTTSVLAYDLTIDGVAQPSFAGQRSGTLSYDYDLSRNAADHGGTPDPVLSIAVIARDALGQTSPASTATATNAAPPATSITTFSGRLLISLTITPSAAADLKDYRVRVYRDGSLVRTLFVTAPTTTYTPEDGNGSYRFDVAARDLFGQVGTASAQTAAADLIDPGQFVADLRAGLIYTDSVGTSQSALAGLKDADLATNVITYGASTPWRWTQADWQEEITTQIVELALSATASIYLGYSIDGTTWTYYHGGTPASGRWTPASTTATEATAQGGAVSLAAGTWRIKLSAPRRARYIRLGHRNTSASYALREFFPATLVRATYIEAENLAAISADLGTVTAGTIIGAIINGGTITGTTIQTATSDIRTVIDSSGVQLRGVGSATNNGNSITFYRRDAAETFIGRINGRSDVLNNDTDEILVTVGSGEAGWSNTLSLVTWRPGDSTNAARIDITSVTSGLRTITAWGNLTVRDSGSGGSDTGSGWFFGGLRVGSAGATPGAGTIVATADITAAGVVQAPVVRATSYVSVLAPSGGVLAEFGNGSQGSGDNTWLQLGRSAATGGTVSLEAFRSGIGGTTLQLNPQFDGLVEVGNLLQVNGAAAINTTNVGGQSLRVRGAGTGTSTYGLAVVNSAGSDRFWVRDDGAGWLAGTLTQASDARRKTAIRPLAPALPAVLALQPRSFTWRDGPPGPQVGLIAQEAAAVLPDLVTEAPDGTLGLNYLGLIPYLIAAVQELSRRVLGAPDA